MKKIIIFMLIFIILLVAGILGFKMLNQEDKTEISNNKDVIQEQSDAKDYGEKITEEMVRNHAVTKASDFEYEVSNDGIKITEYIGKDTIVVIPHIIDGKTVAEIAEFVFANDSIVRGVYFPRTVAVCNGVFANNSCIEVVICEGIQEVKNHGFGNCANLHTVVLGNNLKKLGDFAFAVCPMLTSLSIPNSLSEINEEQGGTIFFCSDNLTIIGESGSVIEAYCKEHGIKFEAK